MIIAIGTIADKVKYNYLIYNILMIFYSDLAVFANDTKYKICGKFDNSTLPKILKL